MIKSKVKQTPDKIDSYIDLDKIDTWKKHPSIRNLLSNLSFIKSQDHWGRFLQGGFEMGKRDRSVILEEAKKLKQT